MAHSEEFSKANEFDTFEFDQVKYPIKWYGGILFATEDLSDAMIGEDGVGINPVAVRMDEKIAYYFEEGEFHGKTGEELYQIAFAD